MRGINYVLIGGNIGRDPEIKYLANGTAVATLSLAVSQKWKDNSGESKERTDWIRVVGFGGIAEIVGKSLSKGDSIIVMGRLSVRGWEDKDGNKKNITEVVAKEISFVNVKNRENTNNNKDQRSNTDDDVPF